MRRTRHKLEPQCDQSTVQRTVQQTRTTQTTKKKHHKQTSFICGSIHSAHETSVVVLVGFYMLQVFGHIKHVVVLVALLRVLTLVCEFLADFVGCRTAKTGLLRCCLYRYCQQKGLRTLAPWSVVRCELLQSILGDCESFHLQGPRIVVLSLSPLTVSSQFLANRPDSPLILQHRSQL